VLARDAEPRIYVLEQLTPTGNKIVRRRAFIVEVGLEPFSAGIVLPHERTLPKALGDRFELTRATHANLSQVLALFEDADCASDALFDAIATGDPIATATDADDVASNLWASADPVLADRLAALFSDKQLFIADGHHRYTTALAHRDEMRAAETGAPVEPAYDSVMMALVNMDDPELVVMPTHRVADAATDFDAEAFWAQVAEHFDVSELSGGHAGDALTSVDRPSYLVATRTDRAPRLVTLRADVDVAEAIPLDRSHAWKHLDVAVLQELILDPILGIHPDRPETLERLSFVKDPHDALKQTAEHDVVFLLRPTRMEQLRAVALAGETMPQKSTYFYPKLLSGLVFRSAG
jgi:uncharacterized protein (DUF1015 family)